jgi:hypothetical protein
MGIRLTELSGQAVMEERSKPVQYLKMGVWSQLVQKILLYESGSTTSYQILKTPYIAKQSYRIIPRESSISDGTGQNICLVVAV